LDFEILIVETTRIAIFWSVIPCSLIDVYRHFGGAYCLHLQVRIVSQASKKQIVVHYFNLNMEALH
jgi:hypothetical protein